MARFGKNDRAVFALLAIVVLELVALVGALAGTGAPPPEEAPPAPAEAGPAADGGQEAEDTIPAWLEPAPLPEETVTEKERPQGEQTAAELLSGTQVIAHGMGAVGEETTLNCREGFLEQYGKGVRVFEVDLRLTADQRVVLRHDWRAGWQRGVSETAIPTLEEFLDRPLLGKYTPLSFQDLLLLMEEYPDICIITDSKFTEAEIVKLQFESMVQDARELGLSYLFDRMIIQVYDPLMFKVVDAVHHFDHYIYTLYAEGFAKTEEAFAEKASFCRDNGILGITMWDTWWRAEYAAIAQEYGIRVCTHTVNDGERALELLESGVSAVYTDTLTPGALSGADTDGGTGAGDAAGAPPAEDGAPAPEEEGESSHGADGEDAAQ